MSMPSVQFKTNSIDGNVQTCCIKDLQHSYIKIVRESSTSYYICLTVDPTPLYRIEFSKDPSAVGDILVFPASNSSSVAVAAARLAKNPKRKEPVATICTLSPHRPDAKWRPLLKSSLLAIGEEYKSSIPIVTVPGMQPTAKSFAWRTALSNPYFQLCWDGPLLHQPARAYIDGEQDFRHLFATCVMKGGDESQDNLIEMRRGGGLEFELTVVLELFAILYQMNKQLL
jgi:hypothetical protein